MNFIFCQKSTTFFFYLVSRRDGLLTFGYEVPHCMEAYNEHMGVVDAYDARRKITVLKLKSERKHNRTCWMLLKAAMIDNPMMLHACVTEQREIDSRGYIMDILYHLHDEHVRLKHRLSLARRIPRKKSVENIKSSLRFAGKYPNPMVDHVIIDIRTDIRRKSRIKCFYCRLVLKKDRCTWYKCNTCMIHTQEVGFCHPSSGRNCFALFELHQ